MPQGVAPDLARMIAAELDLELQLVSYDHPNLLCEAAERHEWDVCFVGADPARAGLIEFTEAYVEIECCYVVPATSKITSIEQVDQPGHKIAVKGGAAYDLWLQRNIKNA